MTILAVLFAPSTDTSSSLWAWEQEGGGGSCEELMLSIVVGDDLQKNTVLTGGKVSLNIKKGETQSTIKIKKGKQKRSKPLDTKQPPTD